MEITARWLSFLLPLLVSIMILRAERRQAELREKRRVINNFVADYWRHGMKTGEKHMYLRGVYMVFGDSDAIRKCIEDFIKTAYDKVKFNRTLELLCKNAKVKHWLSVDETPIKR